MAKPKIEFFTEHEALLEFAPVPAKRALPDWFKRMPAAKDLPASQGRFPFGLSAAVRLSNVNATIRRCPGLISYLSEGYLLPLWSDFLVQVRRDTVYCVGSNETAHISPHSKASQYETMPLGDEFIPDSIKFTNPWKVRTPPGWSVLLSQPFYHFENRFQVLTGVVDSDVYHHIHVNTLFRRGDADHKLNMGQPFVHIMPFQRAALELDVRKMTEQDNKRMQRLDFRAKRFFRKNATIRGDGQNPDE